LTQSCGTLFQKYNDFQRLCEHPIVEASVSETIWCLFCNRPMESLIDQKEAYPVLIKGAHVIEHLAQKQHQRHVAEFLRIHRIKQHPKTCFILSENAIQHYKRKFNSFWIHHREKHKEQNEATVPSPSNEASVPPALSESHPPTNIVPSLPERPLPTASGEAHLEYMILRSKILKVMGKERLLLPGRVGGTTLHRHGYSMNERWLPNYGSVWNPGSRKQTREAFHQIEDERKDTS
jgi:hypothetical protein